MDFKVTFIKVLPEKPGSDSKCGKYETIYKGNKFYHILHIPCTPNDRIKANFGEEKPEEYFKKKGVDLIRDAFFRTGLKDIDGRKITEEGIHRYGDYWIETKKKNKEMFCLW